MRITVRLFAMLRERAGWRERELELPAGATVEDAWQMLISAAPDLAAHRDVVRFAVNREYAATDTDLDDGDELAIIPPVAGGSDAMHRFEITPDAISEQLVSELRDKLATPADGAFVVFVGQTRDTPGLPAPNEVQTAAQHEGEPVAALEYEAYSEMAIQMFRTIAAEIEQRFGVTRLAIIHRIGRVDLQQPSVVVAAAAAHRGAAFDAARYAIDELKARAPIWKAEQYAGGSVWIGAPPRAGSAGEGH